MSKFDKDIINYDIEIYGSLINFVNEISENSYLSIKSFDDTKSKVILSFKEWVNILFLYPIYYQ